MKENPDPIHSNILQNEIKEVDDSESSIDSDIKLAGHVNKANKSPPPQGTYMYLIGV
jgi:hypothetical protein